MYTLIDSMLIIKNNYQMLFSLKIHYQNISKILNLFALKYTARVDIYKMRNMPINIKRIYIFKI